MTRLVAGCLVLAACAAPGHPGPGAAPDAELLPLLRQPPVVRVAFGDHAGNAVVLPGGRLGSVRHVFVGTAGGTLKVDGHETGFTLLGQGPGGPTGDWAFLALDRPELLAGHQVLPRAGAVEPDQEIVIVGYVPVAPDSGREDLRALVALRGRTVAAPWLLQDATRGAICLQLAQPPRDFHGLSGSPAFVREEGGWRLCGVYSSQVTCWPWCEVSVVTPLPDAAP